MPRILTSESADAVQNILGNAVDLADVGIVLLDNDLRLRLVNQHFTEMFNPPAALLATAPRFRDLLEYFGSRSWYMVPDAELPEFYDQREAAVRGGAVSQSSMDLHDGRRLLFSTAVCPDGGRVLTYIDISKALAREAQDVAERVDAELRFSSETMEEQADYLAKMAEAADDSRRKIDATRLALEEQIAEHAKLEAKLRHMATTDGLTGALNRAGFMALGERALEQPCALLMLDVDHFKAINDRYGHAGGDVALRHLVSTLAAETPQSDLVGRLGGEEFAVLLHGATTALAHQVAERLRRRVGATPVPYGEEVIEMTVSVGLAIKEGLDDTLEKLLGQADLALYQAKRSGRNQVVMHHQGIAA